MPKKSSTKTNNNKSKIKIGGISKWQMWQKVGLASFIIASIGLGGYYAYGQWKADDLQAKAYNWTWPATSELAPGYAAAFCKEFNPWGPTTIRVLFAKPRHNETNTAKVSFGSSRNTSSWRTAASSSAWWGDEVTIVRATARSGEKAFQPEIDFGYRKGGAGLGTFSLDGLKTYC